MPWLSLNLEMEMRHEERNIKHLFSVVCAFFINSDSRAGVTEDTDYYGMPGVQQACASVKNIEGDVVVASHSDTIPLLAKYGEGGKIWGPVIVWGEASSYVYGIDQILDEFGNISKNDYALNSENVMVEVFTQAVRILSNI